MRCALFIVCGAVLVGAVGTSNAKQKAEPVSVPGLANPNYSLVSGIIQHSIPVGKAKASMIQITTGGKEGTISVTFDTTEYKINAFGDPVSVNAGPDNAHRVTFTVSVPDSADPMKHGRKRYALVPAAKGEFEGRFALVVPPKAGEPYAMLVLDKDGKTASTISLKLQYDAPLGCHPGCFPGGTLVQTPNGTKAIETIAVGDEVTTINAAGKPVTGKVAALFTGQSPLVEIETSAGKLICTPKQPLPLANGEIKSAGQVVAGDKLFRWVDGKTVETEIVSIKPGEKAATIYNLILVERVSFVANGYMVRSKPPAKQ